MKKIIIIAGMVTILSSMAWAQNQTQNNHKPKDQNETQMQHDDRNHKKAKKDTARKMNKSKKNNSEANLKMDNYESTKQKSTGTPAEQRHMDSTINNHR